MKKRQISKLKRVLKFEQRTLDSYIQRLQMEVAKLDLTQNEMNSLDQLRDKTLKSLESPGGFSIGAVQNRTDFVQKIDATLASLAETAAKQKAQLKASRTLLQMQRTRVKAFETLIEKMEKELQLLQLHKQNIELGDSIISRSMEPKA